jgi:hypothetical protein
VKKPSKRAVRSAKRQRAIQLRVTAAELRYYTQMARRVDLPLSEFIRRALSTHAKVEGELAARAAKERAEHERALIDARSNLNADPVAAGSPDHGLRVAS